MEAKGAKRSVKMWATNFYNTLLKNILLYMNGRLSKIMSIHVCYTPDGLFWLNLYLVCQWILSSMGYWNNDTDKHMYLYKSEYIDIENTKENLRIG